MDRTSIRAWRRIQNKRVWRNRLRRVFNTYAAAHVVNSSTGMKHDVATWKELRNAKWCQVYRTTGKPCSCELCTGERYRRTDFKSLTNRDISEQMEE